MLFIHYRIARFNVYRFVVCFLTFSSAILCAHAIYYFVAEKLKNMLVLCLCKKSILRKTSPLEHTLRKFVQHQAFQ